MQINSQQLFFSFTIMVMFYPLSTLTFSTLIIFFLILNINFFYTSSRVKKTVYLLVRGIRNNLNLNNNNHKILFLTLFFLIFFTNFFRLFSYIFSFSCLPVFCLILGRHFWVLFFIINMTFDPQKFFAHLVPAGCPVYLISFIIFIEIIRLLIRPLTLRVRLIANITAGHLLLFLVSKIFIATILMFLLEILVRFIQAFVFCLLLTLYFNETN